MAEGVSIQIVVQRELREALRRRAELEGRTLSNLAGLLLRRAMSETPDRANNDPG